MAQTATPCRWALLGLSSIAQTFVEDILLPRDSSDPISHIVTSVSTTGGQERAHKWLSERKVPNSQDVTVFATFEKMLKSGDFDVIYISTPHPLHYPHALAALNHKRNVLLEKPATMNRPQLERLIQVSKEQGVVFMEAMWTRYLPATLFLQQHIMPQIGPIRRVFADLSVPIASKDMDLTSRLLDKGAGAGAWLDMGIYCLAWADVVLNPDNENKKIPKVVFADSIPYYTGKEDVDDINTVVISGKSESSGQSRAVAIVTTSLTLAGSNKSADKLAVKKVGPSVKIEAENAQVCIPFPLIRPQELHVEWYGSEHLDEKGDAKAEVIKLPVERGWGLWYQADVIAKAVRDRKSENGQKPGLAIGEEESLRVMQWLDDARELAGIKYNPASEAV
ncbi:hypothetical protein ANO14919_086430 [Xylariales sp. No.14919]|nr:hypothetical protein ANO14919_086430 [Xylariales sp. No.14919]